MEAGDSISRKCKVNWNIKVIPLCVCHNGIFWREEYEI